MILVKTLLWRRSSACHQRTTQSISWRFVKSKSSVIEKGFYENISRMWTLRSFSARLLQSLQTQPAAVGRWDQVEDFFFLFSSSSTSSLSHTPWCHCCASDVGKKVFKEKIKKETRRLKWPKTESYSSTEVCSNKSLSSP